jgi:hypothetical protein
VGGKVLDFDGTADAGRQLIAQQKQQLQEQQRRREQESAGGDGAEGRPHRRRSSAMAVDFDEFCMLAEQVRKGAELAQKLGQLQPFIAVFTQECMGQLASFGPA